MGAACLALLLPALTSFLYVRGAAALPQATLEFSVVLDLPVQDLIDPPVDTQDSLLVAHAIAARVFPILQDLEPSLASFLALLHVLKTGLSCRDPLLPVEICLRLST